MEIIKNHLNQLIDFLQNQGYSLPNNLEHSDFHMYRPISPDRYRRYPRFHFHIREFEEEQFPIEKADIHFDQRPHRSPLMLGDVQEITARERLRLYQALSETSDIDALFKTKLSGRLNHLQLFDSAERLDRLTKDGSSAIDPLTQAAKQRKRPTHHKYIRNKLWKLEVLEDLLSV